MHDQFPALGVTAPARRGAPAHATAGHARGDAAATIHGGASVCDLKYRIFGHPRFLLRGLRGAQTEISLAVAAYNLKRMRNILGGHQLASALRTV
jgi:hypothetical protein